MNTHGISQNEVARRAGLSSAYLSQIMPGKSKPSPGVLKRLHGVLFQWSQSEERVMPAEVKVLGGGRASAAGWWCVALVGLGVAVRMEAVLFGLAVACPRVRKWTTRIARGTTAGAGCW